MPDIEEIGRSLNELKDEYSKSQLKFAEWHTKLRADLDNLLEAHKERWINCSVHKSGVIDDIKELKKSLGELKVSVGINTKIIGIAIIVVPIITNLIIRLIWAAFQTGG